MNTPSIPRPAAARGATRRPASPPGTRRTSTGGALPAGYAAGVLLWSAARAVRKHRKQPRPHTDRPPYGEHPPHAEPRLHAVPEVRDDSAPHFVLKPGPPPSHTEPREPHEMPRDGKRRTARHLAGFGNLPTRPRPHDES